MKSLSLYFVDKQSCGNVQPQRVVKFSLPSLREDPITTDGDYESNMAKTQSNLYIQRNAQVINILPFVFVDASYTIKVFKTLRIIQYYYSFQFYIFNQQH